MGVVSMAASKLLLLVGKRRGDWNFWRYVLEELEICTTVFTVTQVHWKSRHLHRKLLT